MYLVRKMMKPATTDVAAAGRFVSSSLMLTYTLSHPENLSVL